MTDRTRSRRRIREWKAEVWADRDPVIRAEWGVTTARALSVRFKCDPHDVRDRAKLLGLDLTLGHLARSAAQRRVARERALKQHAARREREQVAERGHFLQMVKPASDGAADVRRTLARSVTSVFDLGRLAA